MTSYERHERIIWHDLRATTVTWWAVASVDPLRIKQRAGHATFSTPEGYIREAENLREGFGSPRSCRQSFGPIVVYWAREPTIPRCFRWSNGGSNPERGPLPMAKISRKVPLVNGEDRAVLNPRSDLAGYLKDRVGPGAVQRACNGRRRIGEMSVTSNVRPSPLNVAFFSSLIAHVGEASQGLLERSTSDGSRERRKR